MQKVVNLKINETQRKMVVDASSALVGDSPLLLEDYLSTPRILAAVAKFEDGIQMMIGYGLASDLTVCASTVLMDKYGNHISEEVVQAIEDFPGYDISGDYGVQHGKDMYTVVLNVSDDGSTDFVESTMVQLPVASDLNSVDEFEVPEDGEYKPFIAAGFWGVTCAGAQVSTPDEAVRYELLAYVTRDPETGKVSEDPDFCENIIISDGKHFNKVVSVSFMYKEDDDAPAAVKGSAQTIFSDFYGNNLTILLHRV